MCVEQGSFFAFVTCIIRPIKYIQFCVLFYCDNILSELMIYIPIFFRVAPLAPSRQSHIQIMQRNCWSQQQNIILTCRPLFSSVALLSFPLRHISSRTLGTPAHTFPSDGWLTLLFITTLFTTCGEEGLIELKSGIPLNSLWPSDVIWHHKSNSYPPGNNELKQQCSNLDVLRKCKYLLALFKSAVVQVMSWH